MKLILSFLLACAGLSLQGQESDQKPLIISGYLESYYGFDFGKPRDHERPFFLYSHNRHNEINVNLGYLKAAFNKANVRANLAFAIGTYINANLANEPGVLKNAFEANAGVKLSKKADLWLDAGIFPSHIGFESAIGKDCETLTRSILADNSPYYESGIRISFTSSDSKWLLTGLILNGWQRIQRVSGNNSPAFGHQLTYKPSTNITLNSSSFIGNDQPDSLKRMRYFHNFFGKFQLGKGIELTLGFDFGIEQASRRSSSYHNWFSPVLIARKSIGDRNKIAGRIEYYEDPNAVIMDTGTPNGFKTWGYSLNYDYLFSDHLIWRIEARKFSSKDAIFFKNNNSSNSNFCITSSLAISF